MKLVIEISYCTWECSGTSTYPIEYESSEQLLVDLEEFYNAQVAELTKYQRDQDAWVEELRSLEKRSIKALPSRPIPRERIACGFKGGSRIYIEELQEYHDGRYVFNAPEIYTLEEWFEKSQIRINQE